MDDISCANSNWLPWLGLILCLLALAAVGLSAYGRRRWAHTAQMLVSKLEAGRVDDMARPRRFHSEELEGLPAPVQRYFRAVLKTGQGAMVGKEEVMLPWEGRWSDYRFVQWHVGAFRRRSGMVATGRAQAVLHGHRQDSDP